MADLGQPIHELAGAHAVEEADLLLAEAVEQPLSDPPHHALSRSIEHPGPGIRAESSAESLLMLSAGIRVSGCFLTSSVGLWRGHRLQEAP